jgi:hypothetical protein
MGRAGRDAFNNADRFPDMVLRLRCEGEVLPELLLHRERLFAACEYFGPRLKGPYKDSGTKRDLEQRVILDEELEPHEAGVYEAVLRHAYSAPGDALDLHSAAELVSGYRLATRWIMPAAAAQACKQLATGGHDTDALVAQELLDALGPMDGVPASDLDGAVLRAMRCLAAGPDGLGPVVAHMDHGQQHHKAAREVLTDAPKDRWDANAAAALLALPDEVALPPAVAATALGLLAAMAEPNVLTETQLLRVLGDAPEVLRTPTLLACWSSLPEPAALTLACSDRLRVDGEEDVVCLLIKREPSPGLALAALIHKAVRVAELGSSYLVALNNECSRLRLCSLDRDGLARAARLEVQARCGRVGKAMTPSTRRQRLPVGPCLVSAEVNVLPTGTRARSMMQQNTYHKGFNLAVVEWTNLAGEPCFGVHASMVFAREQLHPFVTVRLECLVNGKVVCAGDFALERASTGFVIHDAYSLPFTVGFRVELD